MPGTHKSGKKGSKPKPSGKGGKRYNHAPNAFEEYLGLDVEQALAGMTRDGGAPPRVGPVVTVSAPLWAIFG